MRMIIWLIILWKTIPLLESASNIFKMTNVHCESFNKTLTVFNECRLRAIKRDITVFNMNVTFLKPTKQIEVNAAVLKKYNGYKPFIINFTIDACKFMKKNYNPAANAVFSLFKDFSNMNHSCPYTGDQVISGFYPQQKLFVIPLPPGDYAFLMTWYLNEIKTFVTNVYFSYSNE